MNSQEKLIIAKLLKIAQSQQKTIEALVKRAQQADPIVEYLKRMAQTVVFNAGLSGTTVSANADTEVSPLAGGATVKPGDSNYTVFIAGAPDDNNLKQKFIDNFNKTLAAQKPELDGRVNIIFS